MAKLALLKGLNLSQEQLKETQSNVVSSGAVRGTVKRAYLRQLEVKGHKEVIFELECDIGSQFPAYFTSFMTYQGQFTNQWGKPNKGLVAAEAVTKMLVNKSVTADDFNTETATIELYKKQTKVELIKEFEGKEVTLLVYREKQANSNYTNLRVDHVLTQEGKTHLEDVNNEPATFIDEWLAQYKDKVKVGTSWVSESDFYKMINTTSTTNTQTTTTSTAPETAADEW